MTEINITAFPDDESQIEAIKSVFKALKIKYSISEVSEPEPIYKKEFVEMIQQGEKDLKEGKGINMNIEDLDELCK